MIAPGCILVILLPLLGAVIGHWQGGNGGMLVGLGIGGAFGLAGGGALVWLLGKMRQG